MPSMPAAPKTLQPTHLRCDEAHRALLQGYDEALLERLMDHPKTLAIEYKKGTGEADRDAMYKYRELLKEFAKVNPAGVKTSPP